MKYVLFSLSDEIILPETKMDGTNGTKKTATDRRENEIQK